MIGVQVSSTRGRNIVALFLVLLMHESALLIFIVDF